MAQTNEMTGGEAMARMLKAFNAGPMFGMGGFQLLAVLRRGAAARSSTTTSSTTSAAARSRPTPTPRSRAASAWSMQRSGPGATNLVTGLVEALNAGTPLVAFIGDTHRAHSWKNMTQESRQTEILRPACKELLRIERRQPHPRADPPRLPRSPRRAGRARWWSTCRRTSATARCPSTRRSSPSMRATRRRPRSAAGPRPTTSSARRALLAEAKRPLMLCGGGVHISQAADDVTAFAQCPRHPGRAHHDRQGRDRLHRSAERRPVRPLRPHRQRADRRGRRAAGRRLQARRDRHQALHHAAAGQDASSISTSLPEEFGRTYQPTVALWGDVREGIARSARRRSAGDAQAAASRARRLCRRASRKRMAAWKAGVMERLTSDETPINVARMLHELNRRDAGRRHPGRRRRLRRPLGRAALRHQAGRAAASCRTAASPRSATACRAPSARRWPPRAGRWSR